MNESNPYTRNDVVRMETVIAAMNNTAAYQNQPDILNDTGDVNDKRFQQAWHRIWRKAGFPTDFKLMHRIML